MSKRIFLRTRSASMFYSPPALLRHNTRTFQKDSKDASRRKI